jgi:hypothetical protein
LNPKTYRESICDELNPISQNREVGFCVFGGKMVDEHDLNREFEELRLLFQIAVDDIKYAKRLQWTIGYSILLGFTAIIGLIGLIKFQYQHTCFTQNLIYFIPILLTAILINLLGMYHLMDIQHVLSKGRMRLVAIKLRLGNKFQQVIEIADELKGDAQDYYAYKRYFNWNLQFFGLFAVGIYFVGIMILGDRQDWFWVFFGAVTILNVCCYVKFYRSNKNKCEKAEENLNNIKKSIPGQSKKQSAKGISVK